MFKTPESATAEEWSNKEFMLKVVKYNGDKLHLASEELRQDVDIVMAAFKQRGGAMMKHVSPYFIINFLLRFIKREQQEQGSQQLFPSKEKRNEMLMIEHILRCEELVAAAAKLIPPEIARDKPLVLQMLKFVPTLLKYGLEELANDHQFVRQAMNQNNRIYASLPQDLKINHDLAIYALKTNADTSIILTDLWRDREFARRAIRLQPSNIYSIGRNLRYDKELLLEAYRNYHYYSPPFLENLLHDREFQLQLIEIRANVCYAIPERMRERQFALEAVKRNREAWFYLMIWKDQFEFIQAFYCRPLRLNIPLVTSHPLHDITIHLEW